MPEECERKITTAEHNAFGRLRTDERNVGRKNQFRSRHTSFSGTMSIVSNYVQGQEKVHRPLKAKSAKTLSYLFGNPSDDRVTVNWYWYFGRRAGRTSFRPGGGGGLGLFVIFTNNIKQTIYAPSSHNGAIETFHPVTTSSFFLREE